MEGSVGTAEFEGPGAGDLGLDLRLDWRVVAGGGTQGSWALDLSSTVSLCVRREEAHSRARNLSFSRLTVSLVSLCLPPGDPGSD